MLQVSEVDLSFGGLDVLRQVTFDISSEGVVGIIGPNGSGKTSLFNCISGFYHPTGGAVHFNGTRLNNKSPDAIVSLGISRTFQSTKLIPSATILENVLLASHIRLSYPPFVALLAVGPWRRSEREAKKVALDALAILGIERLANESVQGLPMGIRRLVELARTMVQKPSLLLLDEPASGLNDDEKDDLSRILLDLRKDGLSMLLVEHNIGFVTQLAHRVIAMDMGRVIFDGPVAECVQSPAVLRAYLGDQDEA
jgi:branched-chain amino acid transport system ATP-binding protein